MIREPNGLVKPVDRRVKDSQFPRFSSGTCGPWVETSFHLGYIELRGSFFYDLVKLWPSRRRLQQYGNWMPTAYWRVDALVKGHCVRPF